MSSDAASSDRVGGSPKQIHDDHENIKGILERVTSASDVKGLVPILQELRKVLAAHFLHEEEPGGLRDAVCASQPHLDPRVDAILGEHREFLDDVDSLVERAREVVEVTVPNLLLDVADMTRRLRDHEIRETELLTEAKYTDLGELD